MNTTVVITLYNDPKVKDTIESLANQTRKPDMVLIADGGSPKEFQKKIINLASDLGMEWMVLTGRCLETRYKVINYLKDKTEIIAFIDSDEWAHDDWLENLIVPIECGRADFTAGMVTPTKAITKPEAILNAIQYRSQDLLNQDITYMQMGNSAWNMKIFKTIGNFDASEIAIETDKGKIGGSYHISEDYDLNIRAVNAGFKGLYVENAIINHNQSRINTTNKLIRYFFNQFVRTSIAYFKNKSTISKFTSGTTKLRIAHPFVFFLIILKPIALTVGWTEWNKMRR